MTGLFEGQVAGIGGFGLCAGTLANREVELLIAGGQKYVLLFKNCAYLENDFFTEKLPYYLRSQNQAFGVNSDAEGAGDLTATDLAYGESNMQALENEVVENEELTKNDARNAEGIEEPMEVDRDPGFLVSSNKGDFHLVNVKLEDSLESVSKNNYIDEFPTFYLIKMEIFEDF